MTTESPSPIILTPRGPFSLAASIRFLEGFGPARYRAAGDGVLRLAFPVETPDARWPVVGVAIRQQPDGTVVAEPDAPLADDLRERAVAQLARILSLDVDGSGFPALAADPVVAGLQMRFPGLRPVCFTSPYEAACWAVLSHRVRRSQAAVVKARLTAVHGARRTVAGVQLSAFPDPATLLALPGFDGIPDGKLRWLHGLAHAAADGRLTGERLRGLDPAEALVALRRLPGVGPFSAELTLIRGAGAPDVFPLAERRLHGAMVELYALPGREPARLTEVAHRWAPYRSWVSVLIRSLHEAGLAASGDADADRPTELPAGRLGAPGASGWAPRIPAYR
ncbi:DNA-3-methyladenine glycosylase family protein [Cryptosporangium minutisporangium]|uniref:DNA-3-methyladenine glycosylase n=1 Tax=Cryptosporangium minutisporangium TaxID=113569 RepID=A0ABP6SWU0_9ACTN